MSTPNAFRLAILADPHLHDTRFGLADSTVVRSLRDTSQSTRVFNESAAALDKALAQIAAEGIGLCIIVGDLTDDGQPANWAAVQARLAQHTARHGTRFFATPGNHDQWGPHGKALSKGCVDADGARYTVAGTPPGSLSPHDVPGMWMLGYDAALTQAAAFGYSPNPQDLHWETPFGLSSRIGDRRAPMTGDDGTVALVPDASYLVEPASGLWLLSIDANVYRPNGQGGFVDHSPEGWIATLAHKPYLLPWMRDVAARAKRLGKQLVAFSHYPVVDVFGGPGPARAGKRQMPDAETTAQIAATGLRLHFSGHWHVDALGGAGTGPLVNAAVPSTVAFPAGWKLLEISGPAFRLHDRPLGDAPGWDRWLTRYKQERGTAGDDGFLPTKPPLDNANSYPDFLNRHFRTVVLTRRLADDWPPELGPLMALPLSEIPEIFNQSAPLECDLPLREIFVDYYRLRETGSGPAAGLPPARHQLCKTLSKRFCTPQSAPCTEAVLLASFFALLSQQLAVAEARPSILARLATPNA